MSLGLGRYRMRYIAGKLRLVVGRGVVLRNYIWRGFEHFRGMVEAGLVV